MQLLKRLGISPEKSSAEKDSQQQEADLHQAIAEQKTDHLFYRAS
jgi:biotin synthase